MGETLPPFVSVVTPFYNTEAYLAECIGSVLGQTFRNFEYILVNNCSTDGSVEIALAFARKDPRIRVVHNDTFLSQIQNYNSALREMSAESRYCKIVQADDWIFPECLSRMVAVAESDSTVGVVTSYALEGNRVKCAGLPYHVTVAPGREVCRAHFLDGLNVFGSQTTVLYRSAIVRSRDPFFDEVRFHSDTDVMFRILADWNLGFVHQVLSFSRINNPSITTAVRDYEPYRLDKFLRAKLYSRNFLTEEEASRFVKRAEAEYFRFLGGRILERQTGAGFWTYHRSGLSTIGEASRPSRLVKYLLLELLDLAGNPKRTLTRLVRTALKRVRFLTRGHPIAPSGKPEDRAIS